MDQWIALNAAACWSAPDGERAFAIWTHCTLYPSEIFGYAFQRSYSYIGITSSALFYPLSLVFHPDLARHLLIVTLSLLTILGFSKSFKLSLALTPLWFLYFPIGYNMVLDSGPVLVNLVAIAWTPWLFLRFKSSVGTVRFVYPGLAAVLFLLATEDKPFFLALVPMQILLSLAAAGRADVRLQNTRKSLSLFYSIASIGPMVVLFASSFNDKPYILHLAGSNAHVRTGSTQVAEVAESALPNVLRSLSNGIWLTIDWHASAHRAIDPGEQSIDPSMFLLARFSEQMSWISRTIYALGAGSQLLFSLVIILWMIYANSRRAGTPSTTFNRYILASFIVGLFSVVAFGGWAHHHFFFLHIPLLLFILVWFERAQTPWYRSVWIAFSAWSVLSISFASNFADRSYDNVVTLISEVEERNPAVPLVVNCASWGCYFQSVHLTEARTAITNLAASEGLQELSHVAQKEGRRLVHLCRNCREEMSNLKPTSEINLSLLGESADWSAYVIEPR